MMEIAEFSIRGTKKISYILTISEDELDPDGTGSLSYQWQSSSKWKKFMEKYEYKVLLPH